MITKERKVTLNWVLNPTAFEAINKDSFVSLTRPLGTGVRAVNKMLAKSEEMEMLLPDILGVSPGSASANWQGAVSNYWHNFGIDVPQSGKNFNTSITFDLMDVRRQKYIDALVEDLKLNKTKRVGKSKEDEGSLVPTYSEEEKLELFAEHVMTKVPEELIYRYGHPVAVEDYLAWRYCLESSDVSNTPDLMVKSGSDGEIKSSHIKFYLIDDATVKKQKAVIQEARNSAVAKLSTLLSSKDTSEIDNILISADKVLSIKDLKELTEDDKKSMLFEMTTENPSNFIKVVDDKILKQKAEVKKFVMTSLIRQLPNSSIYVDASDSSIVLGNTINEVVSYIAASVNAAYVNELRLKMNQLLK